MSNKQKMKKKMQQKKERKTGRQAWPRSQMVKISWPTMWRRAVEGSVLFVRQMVMNYQVKKRLNCLNASVWWSLNQCRDWSDPDHPPPPGLPIQGRHQAIRSIRCVQIYHCICPLSQAKSVDDLSLTVTSVFSHYFPILTSQKYFSH